MQVLEENVLCFHAILHSVRMTQVRLVSTSFILYSTIVVCFVRLDNIFFSKSVRLDNIFEKRIVITLPTSACGKSPTSPRELNLRLDLRGESSSPSQEAFWAWK